LDLHADYIHGCEWTPDATDDQKERHFQFPTTQKGWSRLINQLNADCWVALEVPGDAFDLYDMLSPHAGQVLLANPIGLKRLGSGRHTDRVDAARLAKMLAVGTVPTVWVPPHQVREMRRLLHYRDRLGRTRRRFVLQAKAILRNRGHRLSRHDDLQSWVTPAQLHAFSATDQVLLRSTLRQIGALEEEIATLETEIAAHATTVPAVSLLMTLPGMGMIIATATWATLGDAGRFATAKSVTRYVGLDPSVVQSGDQHRQGRISKNGSRFLRTLLVEAANTVAHHDKGPLGQFYQHMRERRGHKKAVVALARKLLIIAWRMLQTGEVYRNANPAAVARKHRDLRKMALRHDSTQPVGQTEKDIPVTTRPPIHTRTPVPA
jgi:transposase